MCYSFQLCVILLHELNVNVYVQCDRTVALSALFEQLATPPNKLALIDASCSAATEPTSEVSHFFKISQVLCTIDK